jgi:outer membrane protein
MVSRVKNSIGSSSFSVYFRLFTASLLVACMNLCSCSRIAEQPELDPERWAPGTAQREWSATAWGGRESVNVESLLKQNTRSTRVLAAGKPYDLAALIDLALQQNPDTRAAWEQARAAAAGWAIKRAPFYPLLSVSSESGYERMVDLVPKHWGTLKNWQSTDLVTLDYLLIDFGRRDAAAEAARDRLLAANFEFNREIQTILFEVEKNYYLLDAQRAGLDAAHAVVKLAEIDLRAVERRHAAGLATKPEVLLAQQREAKSVYELQNAELAVSDAEAELAIAVGVRVDSLPLIQTSNMASIPGTLKISVDDLITQAIRQRPDLAAAITNLRSKDAEVALARAEMYPTLSLRSYYGTYAFNYRLSNPATPQYTAMAPEYTAILALNWDAFAGMAHVNTIEQAQDERAGERAHLRALEINVASQVWRAYYAFETSIQKYHYAVKLLESSQAAYDANLRSFTYGLATIVDLLAAERDLADAKYTLIQSQADVLISAAAVAYSAGAIVPPAVP